MKKIQLGLFFFLLTLSLLFFQNCSKKFQSNLSTIDNLSSKGILTPRPDLDTSGAPSTVIDEIRESMGKNEAPLLNAPVGPGWSVGAIIEMGGALRGDATPYWWKPNNPVYKSPTPWNAIAPWFVIYPGKYNAAKNVRVKVYGLKLFMWNKVTLQWIKIETGSGKPLWAGNYGFNLVTTVSGAPARTEPDGELSYKLDASSHPIHGGLNKIDLTKFITNTLDIGAVIVYIKTQLILDNVSGIDDRDSAQILFNVGADYYPTMATKMTDFSPMSYVPCVGSSRFSLVRKDPKAHYMATIDPPGVFNTISAYTLSGGSITMPDDYLADNLPPLPGVTGN